MTAIHHLIFRYIVCILTVTIFIANIFSHNAAEIVLSITLAVCGLWMLINSIILYKRINEDYENAFHNGFGFEPIFFILPLLLIHKFLF